MVSSPALSSSSLDFDLHFLLQQQSKASRALVPPSTPCLAATSALALPSKRCAVTARLFPHRPTFSSARHRWKRKDTVNAQDFSPRHAARRCPTPSLVSQNVELGAVKSIASLRATGSTGSLAQRKDLLLAPTVRLTGPGPVTPIVAGPRHLISLHTPKTQGRTQVCRLLLQEAVSTISRARSARQKQAQLGFDTRIFQKEAFGSRATGLTRHNTLGTPPTPAEMDRSSSPPVQPPFTVPRHTRDRERGWAREQEREASLASSRRPNANAPHAISTADPSRDRDSNDVFGDWTDRDRERYVERYLRDRNNDPVAPARLNTPGASPEVISSLITSLSAFSRPLSAHFESPSYLNPNGIQTPPNNTSTPSSPTGQLGGSFGVDYGAYTQPSLNEIREGEVSLDELAAAPPVIRTSKPPSGFSPLTAQKSPRSPGTRDASGLRSLLSRSSSGGLSRPSSRGSVASGAESIGKPSIERSRETQTNVEGDTLKRQNSHDSWGKKSGRNQRGLMYMSSRERLKENEATKKRASIGAVGSHSNGLASTGGNLRLDPLSAESVINEESLSESPPQSQRPSWSADTGNGGGLPSQRPIPTRDSSLRKTGPNAKRSSARNSKSKRDSDGAANDTIQELDEHSSGTRNSKTEAKRRQATIKRDDLDPVRLSADLSRNPSSFSKPRPDIYSTSPSTPASAMFPDLDPVDDGAPSPAVAQGRRRDRDTSAERRYRRRSGHLTPDPLGGYLSENGSATLKTKRSSSRLKRLSGAASPTTDRSSDHGVSARNSHSDQPHIAYERPTSADSVDDAVESYLCSPRLSQKIRHPQTGRVISFSEVGDPSGSAVFCCVGMGLTRYITAFYDELALTLKLRLITPDRPGVGDSEPYAEGTATPLGWPGTLPLKIST